MTHPTLAGRAPRPVTDVCRLEPRIFTVLRGISRTTCECGFCVLCSQDTVSASQACHLCGKLDRVTDARRGTPPGHEFARALIAARAAIGFSQTRLAAVAGVHPSLLSRLESGLYSHSLRPQTVDSLETALCCGGTLYATSGVQPPAVRALLVDPDVLDGLGAPEAEAHLRRAVLGTLARSVEEESISRSGSAVEITQLWHAVCLRTGTEFRRLEPTGPGLRSGSGAALRLRQAHTAAHALLSTSCLWPRLHAAEGEAVELACLLLAPIRLVRTAVRAAVQAGVDVWAVDTGGLAAAIADALFVPGWVAVRRLADLEDLFMFLETEELEAE